LLELIFHQYVFTLLITTKIIYLLLFTFQDLVYYKELGRGLIKQNQFVPSFHHLIRNFEAITKCGACACFEKVTSHGLCQLCNFYAKHGMNDCLVNKQFAPSEQINATPDEKLDWLVKKVYGIDSLRESQRTAIKTYLSGKHTFLIMPTGSGKSLSFWASAALYSGLTVVFEPLIALIQDQMVSIDLTIHHLSHFDILMVFKLQTQLIANGIPCGCIYASITQGKSVQERVLREVALGLTRILFTTPEKLQKNIQFRNFLHKVQKERGIQFAIDEAHCVLDYVHFR